MNLKERQKITEEIIFLQKNGRFNEAADLYSSTIRKMDKDKFFPKDSEWIDNLILFETQKIIDPSINQLV
jgi:hypothetical protein